MGKVVNVRNVPDFKDGSGKWVRSYHPVPNERHHTRAEVLWVSILARCKAGGGYQRNKPTYVGCTNGFIDFQELAEWCQLQYGYLSKEANGKYWQLDKDILSYGNKVYSPSNCIFVPQRVNCLFLKRDKAHGTYPLGVSWHMHGEKYRAQVCKGGDRARHLGLFLTPMEAHRSWQLAKIDIIRKMATEDVEITAHAKLVGALLAQAQRIEDDYNNHRETI